MAVGELVTRSGITYSVKIQGTLLSVTSASGVFTYGETITGGTSSATGEVLYYDAADAELIVGQDAGATAFQNAETVTGGTSGATATTDAAPATSYQTSWVTLARVRDSFSVDRTRPLNEIRDFDTNENDFVDVIAGNQSATGSTSLSLVPGSEGFQLIEAAMDYNLDFNLRRVLVSRDSSTTRTRFYTSIVTDFGETDNVDDVSTVSVSFGLSAVGKTDPT